jgi:hypothetical protein
MIVVMIDSQKAANIKSRAANSLLAMLYNVADTYCQYT